MLLLCRFISGSWLKAVLKASFHVSCDYSKSMFSMKAEDSVVIEVILKYTGENHNAFMTLSSFYIVDCITLVDLKWLVLSFLGIFMKIKVICVI